MTARNMPGPAPARCRLPRRRRELGHVDRARPRRGLVRRDQRGHGLVAQVWGERVANGRQHRARQSVHALLDVAGPGRFSGPLPRACPSPRAPRPGREQRRRPRGPCTARPHTDRRPGRCRRNEPGTRPPGCRASPWLPSGGRLLRAEEGRRRPDALPRTPDRRPAHGRHSPLDGEGRVDGDGCGTAGRRYKGQDRRCLCRWRVNCPEAAEWTRA